MLHIEHLGSVSLCDRRGTNGALELGQVLGRIQMNNFNAILEEQLRNVNESSQ